MYLIPIKLHTVWLTSTMLIFSYIIHSLLYSAFSISSCTFPYAREHHVGLWQCATYILLLDSFLENLSLRDHQNVNPTLLGRGK